MSSWTTERARVAAYSRSRDENDPDLVAARTALKTERIARLITQTVDEAPPLTPDQRERLACLLQGGKR